METSITQRVHRRVKHSACGDDLVVSLWDLEDGATQVDDLGTSKSKPEKILTLVEMEARDKRRRRKYRRAMTVHNKFRRKSILKLQIGLFGLFFAIGYLVSTQWKQSMGGPYFPSIEGNSKQSLLNSIGDLDTSGRSPFARSLHALRDSTGLDKYERDLEALVDELNTTLLCAAVENTTKSSLDEYPPDIFSAEQRAQGYIVLHVIGIIYMFIGLAIVCDDYFEASLASICSSLNLKEDVAGATFMAAGGSAPELFTSIMGVASESDIGFAAIVGSATFNVLFVVGVCSFVASNLQLTWWPLTRDSIFYCASILVLVGSAIDKEIEWYESLLLLICYAVYIVIMYYNHNLEIYVTRNLQAAKPPTSGIKFSLYKLVQHDYFNYFIYTLILANTVSIIMETSGIYVDPMINYAFSGVFIAEFIVKLFAQGFFGYWKDALNAFDGILVILILIELCLAGSGVSGGLQALRVFRFLRALRALRMMRIYRMINVVKVEASTQTEANDFRRPTLLQSEGSRIKMTSVVPYTSEQLSQINNFVDPKLSTVSDAAPAEQTEEADEDEDEDEPVYPFEVPEGTLSKIYWVISLPLSGLMFFTIPDCRRPIFKKFFFVTFLMCIVWIAAMAYFMLWMAVTVSVFLEIPEPVMGLTIIAAGTSVPDLLSSVAVARRGFGDMAVSSSIGSNVFDILIGLPVPWFFKTVIFTHKPVHIDSDGLTIMVLSLFIMVACVVSLIHLAKWRLTQNIGYIMMIIYALFVLESLLLEYGLLFPTCP